MTDETNNRNVPAQTDPQVPLELWAFLHDAEWLSLTVDLQTAVITSEFSFGFPRLPNDESPMNFAIRADEIKSFHADGRIFDYGHSDQSAGDLQYIHVSLSPDRALDFYEQNVMGGAWSSDGEIESLKIELVNVTVEIRARLFEWTCDGSPISLDGLIQLGERQWDSWPAR